MLAQEGEISWVLAWVVIMLMAVVMAGAGWVVVFVARQAADGQLGRNAIAGIRTPATLSSDEAWNAAHIAGQRLTLLAGWSSIGFAGLSVVLAGGVAATGGSADSALTTAVVVSGGLGLVGLLGLVIAGAVKGHRAAVAIRDGG